MHVVSTSENRKHENILDARAEGKRERKNQDKMGSLCGMNDGKESLQEVKRIKRKGINSENFTHIQRLKGYKGTEKQDDKT